jgi:hypothetical protein
MNEICIKYISVCEYCIEQMNFILYLDVASQDVMILLQELQIRFFFVVINIKI